MKLNFSFLLTQIILFLIKIYQLTISNIMVNCCRFYPSCSQYAIIAIKKYGIVKGIYLAIIRISKCRPHGKSGYDLP